MNPGLREIILAKIPTVKALPPAARESIQLLQNEFVSMQELKHVLERDPGLAANLLRIANSAAYIGREPSHTLRDALVRLGVRKAIQLVTTDAIGSTINQQIDGYHLPPGKLWEHSVAVAVATEELARALKLNLEPYALTAALLIDIGKIVLGSFVEVDSEPILRRAYDEGMPFDEAERSVLGIDHAEVGAILLKEWKVPDSIVDVVRFHHTPECFQEHNQALDVVHTADLLVSEGGFGAGADGLHYLPNASSVSRLRVNVHILEDVLCRVHGELAVLNELFGTNKTEVV